MMHRASSLLALVTFALVAPGAARTVHAADDELVQQLATFVTLPTLPGEEDDRLAGDTQAAQPLLLTQDEVPTVVMSPQATPADKEVGTPAPFLLDLSPEIETFSMDADTSHQYDAPAERSFEPHNFQIRDSLKVKAQPISGGMGGRVTLTYSFTTGY